MLKPVLFSILILAALRPAVALSSDACSKLAIAAAADVSVSDGSSFKVESYFHSKEISAIRHKFDSSQTIAVEGPQSWVHSDEQSKLGTEFHKSFALGHQFHAFILHFEDIAANITRDNEILFENEKRQAFSGDYPYGGKVRFDIRRQTKAFVIRPILGAERRFSDAAVAVVSSERMPMTQRG